MKSRFLNILCLLFVSLWFGVIAPGHQRGTIKLAGSESCETTRTSDNQRDVAHREKTSCCPMPTASITADGKSDPDHQPPKDPASCCAVCYLNGVLDTPEKPVFVTVHTGLLTELEPLEPLGLSSILAHLLAHIRGPPAFA